MRSTILGDLERAVKDTSEDDSLILAWSGHGLTSNGISYLIPSDGDPNDISTLISTDWLREVLDGCDCRLKAILIDACHSGDDRLTFKSPALHLGIQPIDFANAIATDSRGVLFASSSRNSEVSFVRRDGSTSVWIGNVIAAIEAQQHNPSRGLVSLPTAMTEAASATATETRSTYGKDQVPFTLLRLEGDFPVGYIASNTEALRRDDAGNRRELAPSMERALRRRLQQAYGKSMGLEFDKSTEDQLSVNGYDDCVAIRLGKPAGSATLRLAVSFEYSPEALVEPEDLLRAQHVAQDLPVDRFILPRQQWPASLRAHRQACRNLELLDVELTEVRREGLLKDFFIDGTLTMSESLAVNAFIESILVQMGKIFHVVLADRAAPTYDDSYGKNSFGTHRAMDFEFGLLKQIVSKLPNRSLCVELGCGTGRHTLELAHSFKKSVGYDFSPGMIKVANEKKVAASTRNPGIQGSVEFHVQDIELDPIEFGQDSIDLIVGSFGMGSFISNLVPLLTGLKDQLSPGGRLVLSFYNEGALRYVVPPPWTDSSLSACLLPDKDELEVRLSAEESFRIYCKSYELESIKSQFHNIFEPVEIYSCPSFSAFLPEHYFNDPIHGARARKVIGEIDQDLAGRRSLPFGAYFTIVAGKPATARRGINLEKRRGSKNRWIRLLDEAKVDYESLFHSRVRNTAEVSRAIGVGLEQLAKAVLFTMRDAEDEESEMTAVAVTTGNRLLDFAKVAHVWGVDRRRIRMALQSELALLYGIEIGGVPPFGYGPNVSIFIDRSIVSEEYVYCGVGDPTQSVRISSTDLVQLAGGQLVDVAQIETDLIPSRVEEE